MITMKRKGLVPGDRAGEVGCDAEGDLAFEAADT